MENLYNLGDLSQTKFRQSDGEEQPKQQKIYEIGKKVFN